MIPKHKPFRSRRWMAAVGSIECCVLCGGYGTQVAHRNEGKGMGQKCSDSLTAAICQECHHEIDNGKHLNKEQRHARMDKAIVRTLEQLTMEGLVDVVK